MKLRIALNMRENGKTTKKMEKVKILIKMVPLMKVHLYKTFLKVKENSFQIKMFMKVLSLMVI